MSAPPEFYCSCGKLYDLTGPDGLSCSVCGEKNSPELIRAKIAAHDAKYQPAYRGIMETNLQNSSGLPYGMPRGLGGDKPLKPEDVLEPAGPTPRLCSICRQPVKQGRCWCV